MARPLVDRRLDARFGLPEIAGTQAILRPGYEVSLVDLSSGGALIQGPRPLRPGARVHLQLVSGRRRLALSAHVLRCSVTALDTRQGVQYRGALQFDHRCESLWEDGTLDGYLVPGDDRALTHSGGHGLPGPHPATNDALDRDRK
jgi:PilZ domain-containing protein